MFVVEDLENSGKKEDEEKSKKSLTPKIFLED
jgi:hypothetical protein